MYNRPAHQAKSARSSKNSKKRGERAAGERKLLSAAGRECIAEHQEARLQDRQGARLLSSKQTEPGLGSSPALFCKRQDGKCNDNGKR
ncbi:hypothetical protein [Paenibacillus konkukensis]|uniref:hypothetical protein n=1 Tax=Paenibacillus konkukensis TaxID=2020716 RepID=UPI00201E5210|nr:hypothetical protein [Paenibacillus konkukensis]